MSKLKTVLDKIPLIKNHSTSLDTSWQTRPVIGAGLGIAGLETSKWGVNKLFGKSDAEKELEKEKNVKEIKAVGVKEYEEDKAKIKAAEERGAASQRNIVQLDPSNKVKFDIPLSTTMGVAGLGAGIGAGLLAKHYIDKRRKEKQKNGG